VLTLDGANRDGLFGDGLDKGGRVCPTAPKTPPFVITIFKRRGVIAMVAVLVLFMATSVWIGIRGQTPAAPLWESGCCASV
jgi:hypothetical protein